MKKQVSMKDYVKYRVPYHSCSLLNKEALLYISIIIVLYIKNIINLYWFDFYY